MFGQKENQFLIPLLFIFSLAHADAVRLKTGEVLKGTVTGISVSSVQLITPDGKSKSLDKKTILSIDFLEAAASATENLLFAPTKSDSPFSSPVVTFQTWRKAAMTGNIADMARCFASFKQDEKRKELKKLSKDAFEKMRVATLQTDFVPSAPVYQGDRATMVVNWTKGLDGNEQVLQFILEKNDWKILQ